jgi:hypothetical protein
VDRLVAQISAPLHQTAETDRVVLAISDGTDADCAAWYADWLANLSSIGELLGVRPVRSELTYVLVGLDKEYALQNPTAEWTCASGVRAAGSLATAQLRLAY